jgi:hypothetical protein
MIQHLCDEVVLERGERGSLLSLRVRDRSPAQDPANAPVNSPANGRDRDGGRSLQTTRS